jgi:DNA repair protein RadD
MSRKILRPYQADLIDGIRESLRAKHQKILVQSATGSGKTLVASEVVRLGLKKNNKTVFLAPRRELILQTQGAFAKHGIYSGVIMAGCRPTPSADVQVASFDTLHARVVRSQTIRLPPADIVFVDEAHLSLATTRQEILALYPDATLIGMTATPARGDGRGMGEIYQDLVLGWPVRRLMDEAYLVEARYIVPSAVDITRLKLGRDGDFTEDSLSATFDTPQLVGDVVEQWLKHAENRSTVVFSVNRAHSRHLVERFLKAGVTAEHVDGDTLHGERKDIFARVASGETRVLCNVFVASYGLDIPSLECAVIARATKNLTLYLQEIGRILRPVYAFGADLDTIDQRFAAFTKRDALVIDHAGAVEENGYADDVIPWSLDPTRKVKDVKLDIQKERKEPKPITCPQCATSFSGRRTCPACGFSAVLPTEAIPAYEAELVEAGSTTKRKKKGDYTLEDKIAFMGGLRQYAIDHQYKEGWASHKYKEKFGDWPDHRAISIAPPSPPSHEVTNYIRSRNIARARAGGR